MTVRVPIKKDDMVPSILMEGKAKTEFDPDFFIVQLGHGQPKADQDFNILKNYDFPVENRQQPLTVSSNSNNLSIQNEDLKSYVQRHKHEDKARKFADFHFLFYLMKTFDIETVLTIARNVARQEPVEEVCNDLIESL